MDEYKGNLNVKMTEGTIVREEKVTVTYKPAAKPTLELELERPYEVEATGTQTGTETYKLTAGGKQAKNKIRASSMGIIDAVKAAWNAYKSATQTGGITEEDVSAVDKGVGDYNKVVDQYDRVAGQETVLETAPKTMKVEDLADKELSDLLKK